MSTNELNTYIEGLITPSLSTFEQVITNEIKKNKEFRKTIDTQQIEFTNTFTSRLTSIENRLSTIGNTSEIFYHGEFSGPELKPDFLNGSIQDYCLVGTQFNLEIPDLPDNIQTASMLLYLHTKSSDSWIRINPKTYLVGSDGLCILENQLYFYLLTIKRDQLISENLSMFVEVKLIR